ncbi:MAG: LacI family transcriptional regulator [Lachnospiraceae bacterium]|nr:LacI family transcriptional regulator [Lachnospiraceae bacterium]
MVSIKDIAAALNVSTATVSKALNDAKDISEKRKEQIINKAKEMGYTPNPIARALKTNKTYNLGVLFSDNADQGLAHDFFASILDSFKKRVEKDGYDITFINTSKEGRHGKSLLEHCRHRGFDGVLIACTDYEVDEMIELSKSSVPLVTIDYAYEGKPSVFSDNDDGMRQLVRYAVNAGYKKIAFIHGEMSPVTKERVDAFLDETAKAGIMVPASYIKEGKYRDTIITEKLTEEILKLPEKPECIMYPDDYSALGGVNVLMHRRINIYDDIEVIGYDGILYKRGLPARITSLIQDTAQMGLTAAELLLRSIKEPDFSDKVVVKGKLIEHKNIELMMGAKLP